MLRISPKSNALATVLPRRRRRILFADRRGATSVEYAIMLVFIVLAIGLAFRSIGGKMKRAGNETVQNFDGNPSGAGGGGGAGASGGGEGAGGGAAGAAGGKNGGKNGKNGNGNANGADDGTGAGAAANAKNGGGGGAAAGGGGGSSISQTGTISSDARPEEESTGPSYTRILAIVFMILFAITAFFAFRKGKSQAAG